MARKMTREEPPDAQQAFIVMQRAGSCWVLPPRLRSRVGPEGHVPFVYVNTIGLDPDGGGTYRAAVRQALGGRDPENGSEWMVVGVDLGRSHVPRTFRAERPELPAVELVEQVIEVKDQRDRAA